MLLRTARPFDLSETLLGVFDRAHRCVLHRLRGVQALLGGWAELGAGPEERERLRERQQEAHVLLARLEWIYGMRHRDLPFERLLGGETPQVLLAAAALHATPEEAKDALPEILEPAAALALCCWLQAQLSGERGDTSAVRLSWQGGALEVLLPDARRADLEAWQARFGEYLLEVEATRVVFRPSCFRPAAAEAPADAAQQA